MFLSSIIMSTRSFAGHSSGGAHGGQNPGKAVESELEKAKQDALIDAIRSFEALKDVVLSGDVTRVKAELDTAEKSVWEARVSLLGNIYVPNAISLLFAVVDSNKNDAHNDIAMLDLLLKHLPCSVTQRNNNGKTLLIAATERGLVPLVESIIAAGADVNTKWELTGFNAAEVGDRGDYYQYDVTALSTAIEKGHVDVAALLRKHGAN